MIYRIFFALFAVCPPLFSACFRQFWRTNGGQFGVAKPDKMGIQITGKKSRTREKKWYTFEWGKAPDQRKAAGIFTYVRPKDQIQKNHNKEALALLDTKRSQMIIEQQSIGTVYIPSHKFKDNFLDYYAEFVKNNKREGNRHLEGSFEQFKKFLSKDRLSPIEITENLCKRYRTYLLDKLTGKSPADYFGAFKRVLKSATKEGYFRINPTEDIRSKTNPSKKIRDFLEADEYMKLIKTPIINEEVRDAYITCCFTGLRWCDISVIEWKDAKEDILITRIIQRKTGKPVEITLHPVVKTILANKKQLALERQPENKKENPLSGPIFTLPTADGANKSLRKWVKRAKINKDITWHSARLSFSILLQDANVDTATVALLLGHTTSRYVNETYKRHRPKDQLEHLNKLPIINWEATLLKNE